MHDAPGSQNRLPWVESESFFSLKNKGSKHKNRIQAFEVLVGMQSQLQHLIEIFDQGTQSEDSDNDSFMGDLMVEEMLEVLSSLPYSRNPTENSHLTEWKALHNRFGSFETITKSGAIQN